MGTGYLQGLNTMAQALCLLTIWHYMIPKWQCTSLQIIWPLYVCVLLTRPTTRCKALDPEPGLKFIGPLEYLSLDHTRIAISGFVLILEVDAFSLGSRTPISCRLIGLSYFISMIPNLVRVHHCPTMMRSTTPTCLLCSDPNENSKAISSPILFGQLIISQMFQLLLLLSLYIYHV